MKALIALILLSGCATVATPSRCADAEARLAKAQIVLVEARIALDLACVVIGSEACAKATRGFNDAQMGLDTVQIIVDGVCREGE